MGRFTDTLQVSVTKGAEGIYSQASIKRCPYKQNKCAHATTGNPLAPNTYHLTPIPSPLLKKSTLFTSHLHFPLFRSIFAPAKGTPSRSLFLITSPPTAFHPCYGEVIRPKWLCKTGSLRFSFGPSELSSVAVLQGRSARVGKLIGLMRLMGRMR